MESSNDAQHVARDQPSMFRPPVNRAMRTLDRAFFRTTMPISAAKIFNNSEISKVRQELTKSKDLLTVPRLSAVRNIEEEDGVRKALLLREDLKHDGAFNGFDSVLGVFRLHCWSGRGENESRYKWTWSPTVSALVERGAATIVPFDVVLDYDHWSYADIINAILPEEELHDAPQGYTQVGHVAHLNLREQFLPYKYLIAEIIKDKNASIRTVINKTEDVGSHSQFRTFPFELLTGDNDLNVIQHEQGCEFRFDYARVYWNSRLETEHRRLVEKFQPGQMVCDVMAGVGPFAVPAGKKKIFVWANDLNPHGHEVMEDAVVRNKVQDFVTPFNSDGREFIKSSAISLLEAKPVTVTIQPKIKHRSERKKMAEEGNNNAPKPEIYERPTIFDHYVMNLPATAIEFLDAFQGVYAGKESLFSPNTPQPLPMATLRMKWMITLISASGYPNGLDTQSPRRIESGGSGNPAIELAIYNVRLVSPNKQMFCASFRLPGEVAFRKV
ncbi:tRNA(m(1)G37)methyltransferase [Penicillium herquei]|nr:tRNA(m(1)G37)methyltransferase [Penicillium herquei]